MLLKENYDIYRNYLETNFPDWEKYDKNELIFEACDKSGEERDKFISAIILKYWNKIDKYYYKCKLVTTPEDIHSWLIKAIIYTLDHQPWNDKNSSLYGDSKGPDKSINICMESVRLTFYQQLNRMNRKANNLSLSIENLNEDFSDSFMPAVEDEYCIFYSDVIISYFKNKEYIKAFIIDLILNELNIEKGFKIKSLITCLRKLDTDYFIRFANRYEIDKENVISKKEYIDNMSLKELKSLVNMIFMQLRSELKNIL